MTIKGARRSGQPILVQNNKTSQLVRIALDTKTFNENWIQNLIQTNPDILPIREIEPVFSPAISIGREVMTPVGYIDNLFISADGYLTIIETKLWRNPEARREVVGQILDYAKELSKWTFTDLDKSVVAYNQLCNNNGDGLLATVRKSYELEEADEQYFIDNISKNLKRGRFLLLIVGDGIRESVEDMVEYLSQTPQLYFTLALVELQVFKLNETDNSLIVIPQLITRTREITRAIVRIEGNTSADLKVNIETDLGTEAIKKVSATKALSISAQDFFEQLEKNKGKEIADFANQIIADCENLGLDIEWNSGSFSLKLPDPQESGIKISIVTIDRKGLFYMNYFAAGQFERLQLPIELNYNFVADTAAMLPGIKQNPDKKYIWNKYSTLSDLKPVYTRFLERIKKYKDDITTERMKGTS
jgi:hypothetical protein